MGRAERGWAVAALALLLLLPARGEDSPLALVRATITEVVAEMNANAARYEADEAALEAMVKARVVPHFDLDRMTALALGRHLPEVTPAQRARIRDGMVDLLVRTYARALFEYRNHPLQVVDERRRSERAAEVRLATVTDTGKPVSVILRMENRGAGWKVIDLLIDGVSMVITYRGTFDAEIAKNGVEGLIRRIESGALLGDREG